MVCYLMEPDHYLSQCRLVLSGEMSYSPGNNFTRSVNTLRPRQNGCHFPDDMFKCVFLNEDVWIQNEISLKFVSKGSINNNPALFQIMAWRRLGDKPLSEPMMVSLLTHICVTRPQWVNELHLRHQLEGYPLKITTTPPRDQWKNNKIYIFWQIFPFK